MANTFNVSKATTSKHFMDSTFVFEWDNGAKQTFIVVSLHGAKALAETFKSFGYEEKEGSIKFVKRGYSARGTKDFPLGSI